MDNYNNFTISSSIHAMPSPDYFPSDLYKWIKKNANPRMLLKLMQVCKYFQHKKFPFILLKDAYINGCDSIYTRYNGKKWVFKNVKKFRKNLWLTGSLRIDNYELTRLLQKCVICDIERIEFLRLQISLTDFKFLTACGSVKKLNFIKVKILTPNHQPVAFEDVLSCLPNVLEISIHDDVPTYNYTETNICSKLNSFSLYNITAHFNIEEFTRFIIKTQKTRFILSFDYDLRFNKSYTEKIQRWEKEIFDAWLSEINLPELNYYTQLYEQNQHELKYNGKHERFNQASARFRRKFRNKFPVKMVFEWFFILIRAVFGRK